ncbi:DinB family protein [Streptomyces sp. MST-110588]|uniref:DinB family protein n=1 Tax=Streptomyces sp. MST-110588 TaxID=2833628 RepID=UPI001F5D2A82|nr:DinB family protein [Streptomyces sp. MST-110588]UNO40637.1 DinB family protein [Streptomyces sp. MST-110588]
MPTHVPAEAHGDERGALLAFLEAQRGGLRRSVLGLTDEQATRKPSASELSLAGLLKHVAETEQGWIERAQQVPQSIERNMENWHLSFQLEGEETVAGVLAFWDRVAKGTEKFIRSVPDLNDTFPLPEAPWFPPNAEQSMRWLMLHLIEEVARHAGHADIIRESLDGKTAFTLVDEERAAQS